MSEARSILHILSGDLWAGAEAQAFHLLAALRKRGAFEPHALLLNEGLLAERLRAEGVPVRVVSEKGAGLPSLARWARMRAAETVALLLHTHGYKEDLIAVLANRSRGVPLVRTQHGSPFPGGRLRYRLYYAVDRLAARRSFARTIAVSEAVAGELARFLPPARIARIRNGVPIPPPARGPEAGGVSGGDAPSLVWVGRLSGEKRVDLLIEAIALVRREVPEARLLLIGDGPERASLETMAERTAPGAVRFAGFRADWRTLLAGGEIFVLSSDREGLPMSLLEAMALGLPIVATSVGGVPEALCDGESGLLVEPGSSTRLAGAAGALLRDPALGARIGRGARAAAVRAYDIERTAEETERLYAEVLGER